MFISRREAEDNTHGEHLENKGRPSIFIQPGAGNVVSVAVDELSKLQPGALNDITDIIIDNQNGAFGTYASDRPSTVYLNLSKIESEVRSMLSGDSEEDIQKELLSQVMQTILHEATHEHVYQTTQSTSETEPERKEEELRNQLRNQSKREYKMLKKAWDAEFQNLVRKLDSLDYDTRDFENLMETHDDSQWAGIRNRVMDTMKKIVNQLSGGKEEDIPEGFKPGASMKNYKKIIQAKMRKRAFY